MPKHMSKKSKPKRSIRDEKRVKEMQKMVKKGRRYTQSNITPFRSASDARRRMAPRTKPLPSRRR